MGWMSHVQTSIDNIIQEDIERIGLKACNNLPTSENQDVGTWLQKISCSEQYLAMLSYYF